MNRVLKVFLAAALLLTLFALPGAAAESGAVFSETVLAETDECLVIAKSYDADGDWGPAFTLRIHDSEDYRADDVFNEAVTVTVAK